MAKRLGYTIKSLCQLFGVTKQAYYKHSEKVIDHCILVRFILEFVRGIRSDDPEIGGEKLWYMYKDYFGSELSIGRDAFMGILGCYGLLLRKSRRSTRTTDSNHNYPVYADLIKNLLIIRPNQVWVSDITYIRLREKEFCFLSLVTDAYTHEIVGWYVGPTLEATYTLEAFKQAANGLKDDQLEGLIHHSDRGVQYACTAYPSELKKRKIQISMTQSGDPKDNAIAERVNGILKGEFLNHHTFEHIDQVRLAVDKAVAFYNYKRPHRSLDMKTPVQARVLTGLVNKKWKSYREEYLKTCLMT